MRVAPLRRRGVAPFVAGFALALILNSLFTALSRLGGGDDQAANLAADGAADRAAADDDSPRLLALVGVQTGFTTLADPKYDYAARRAALRATWFPPTPAALDALEAAAGVRLRFVAGRAADAAAGAALDAEAAAHGGFLRLDLVEGYGSLTNKTLAFLRHAAQHFPRAEYVLKLDDDVYLRLDRVPAAVAQWRGAGSDYVGCMKTGAVFKDAGLRWYEPRHALLGPEYFAHAWGSAYALSAAAAARLAATAPGSLRFLSNEDVTVGAWMLALAGRHADDRRLCEARCSPSALVVYDMPTCSGLCEPARQLRELHAAAACRTPPPRAGEALPRLPPLFDFDAAR
jgi:hypothetical protein